jgi:hypothetical protein
MNYVEYSSNNSGGSWWLKDHHWEALEQAGWKVAWSKNSFIYNEQGNYEYAADGTPLVVDESDPRYKRPLFVDADGRYLGALAKCAYRTGLTLKDAAYEWEKITGLNSTDAGCACCGAPHHFSEYRDGKWFASGPETEFVARWS